MDVGVVLIGGGWTIQIVIFIWIFSNCHFYVKVILAFWMSYFFFVCLRQVQMKKVIIDNFNMLRVSNCLIVLAFSTICLF